MTTVITNADPKAIHWRAPFEDCIAHAFQQGRAIAAACGVQWSHPRWDWPPRVRCEVCRALVPEPPAKRRRRRAAPAL